MPYPVSVARFSPSWSLVVPVQSIEGRSTRLRRQADRGRVLALRPAVTYNPTDRLAADVSARPPNRASDEAGGHLNIQAVMEAMGPDLKRVEDRLLEETALEYPLVSEILRGLVAAGGKRLRPLLVLLAARPFHYDVERLVPAAAGIELLHTASLIHDDSIDHAETRRGHPTLNTLFPTEIVIMVGDYMFARSAMLAASTMNPRVLAVFASCLGNICDGQLREIFAARRTDLSLEEYQRRIYGKTASLFAGSTEIGAILGEAADEQIDALRRYGGHLGMAFQIVDDVLDLRESAYHLGKPVGHDLRQGTLTLPTMLFLQQNLGNSGSRELVEQVLAGIADDAALGDAVLAIRQSGAIEQALEIARQYVERAQESLRILPAGEARDMLEAIAEHAIERHS